MVRPLPPLSSLRSFEAVARQLSFSKAAEELHVTPGAISQQVRSLEELLGTRLFDRTRRSVALTDAAMRMLPHIQAGLEMLAKAIASKASPGGDRTLTISVAPSFASKWLVPRLPMFYEQYPDIDLRISATVGLADFKRDKVDLAIRLGHGRYPGLHTKPLFAEALTPFCSPELLKRKGPLKKPDDLRKHRLIHDTSIPGGGENQAWEQWLRLAGAKNVSPQRGVRFTLAELAMQAAIDGAGVVLGRIVLAEGDVAAGRLVRPFKIALPLKVSYFLVRLSAQPPRHEVQCFQEWLFGCLGPSPTARNSRRRSAIKTVGTEKNGWAADVRRS
jgi:LysR family glycine cleavage system transcriptional activator